MYVTDKKLHKSDDRLKMRVRSLTDGMVPLIRCALETDKHIGSVLLCATKLHLLPTTLGTEMMGVVGGKGNGQPELPFPPFTRSPKTVDIFTISVTA